MDKPTCRIDGCTKATRSPRSMCSMHAERKRRTGTTDDPPPRPTLEERLWSRVTKTDTCWLWTGAQCANGYGSIRNPGGTKLPHRIVYELTRGAIPDGQHIDHLCFVRTCVNPDHLQVVTQTENNQNHQGPRRNSRSGVRGVSWSERRQCWIAKVEASGWKKTAHFRTLQEAAVAVVEMRNAMHTNNLIDRC